jgi:hypothetical protein
MRQILLIALLLACTGAYSQEKRYYTAEEQKRATTVADFPALRTADDTLFVDNSDSVFFFAGSPFEYFTGYINLIYYKEVMALPTLGDIGYNLSWVLKDKKLYIKSINVRPDPMGKDMQYDADGNELGELDSVPREAAVKKLEKFLGRKFGADGLLEADWATGNFFLLSVRPEHFLPFKTTEEKKRKYNENLEYRKTHQKIYAVQFEEGKFTGLERRTDLEEREKSKHLPKYSGL